MAALNKSELKAFLDEKVIEYNRPQFIESDPIQIPHLFSKRQDIEIAGLLAAKDSVITDLIHSNASKSLQKLKEFADKLKELFPHNDETLYLFVRCRPMP